MAFRFSLETVLHFRKSVEQAEQATLHQIVQAISIHRAELRQIEENQHSLREQRNRELNQGLPAAHLLEWNDREESFSRAANLLRQELQRLELARQKQMLIFQNARREREILSRIREQRHNTWEREEARKQQKAIDELFLIQLLSERK